MPAVSLVRIKYHCTLISQPKLRHPSHGPRPTADTVRIGVCASQHKSLLCADARPGHTQVIAVGGCRQKCHRNIGRDFRGA
eukprot:3327758-Rhodomonas_salina.2